MTWKPSHHLVHALDIVSSFVESAKACGDHIGPALSWHMAQVLVETLGKVEQEGREAEALATGYRSVVPGVITPTHGAPTSNGLMSYADLKEKDPLTPDQRAYLENIPTGGAHRLGDAVMKQEGMPYDDDPTNPERHVADNQLHGIADQKELPPLVTDAEAEEMATLFNAPGPAKRGRGRPKGAKGKKKKAKTTRVDPTPSPAPGDSQG